MVGERTPHIDSAAEIEELTGIQARRWARPTESGEHAVLDPEDAAE